MIFIIGGSYQGKLSFAQSRFALKDSDTQICTEKTERLDSDKRCIAYLDQFALNRVRAGVDPLDCFDMDALRKDAIVISTDISGGVVPMDPVCRAWREANGRLNNRLAQNADEVWRLFCGIAQRVK